MNWIRFDKEGSFRKRLLCAETGAQIILDPEKRRLIYVEPGPMIEDYDPTLGIAFQTREAAERRFQEIEIRLQRPRYVEVGGNVGINEA